LHRAHVNFMIKNQNQKTERRKNDQNNTRARKFQQETRHSTDATIYPEVSKDPTQPTTTS